MDTLCRLLQVPLDIVSVGPHRDQSIVVRDPFDTLPKQVERLVESLDA